MSNSESIHVRNLFRLGVSLPPQIASMVPADTNVEICTNQSYFGFRLGQNTSVQISVLWAYRFQQITASNEMNLASGSECFEWAKKNKLFWESEPQNSCLVARLKVKEGYFNFRKEKERQCRILIRIYTADAEVAAFETPTFYLLQKKRQNNNLEPAPEVVLRAWSVPSQRNHHQQHPHHHHQTSPSTVTITQLHHRHHHHYHHYAPLPAHPFSGLLSPAFAHVDKVPKIASSESGNYTSSSSSSSPPPEVEEPSLLPLFSMFPAGNCDGHDSSLFPPLDIEAIRDDEYQLLGIGNYEVAGNLRAFNFFKTSDERVKRNIKKIVDGVGDVRTALCFIDGVEYNFDENRFPNMGKTRYLGYLAQQVAKIAPSAVTVIDGVMHVDYTALLPLISESVKKNYEDIQRHSIEIKQLQDQMKIFNDSDKDTDSLLGPHSKKLPYYKQPKLLIISGFFLAVLVALAVTLPIHFFLARSNDPIQRCISLCGDFPVYSFGHVLIYNSGELCRCFSGPLLTTNNTISQLPSNTTCYATCCGNFQYYSAGGDVAVRWVEGLTGVNGSCICTNGVLGKC